MRGRNSGSGTRAPPAPRLAAEVQHGREVSFPVPRPGLAPHKSRSGGWYGAGHSRLGPMLWRIHPTQTRLHGPPAIDLAVVESWPGLLRHAGAADGRPAAGDLVV